MPALPPRAFTFEGSMAAAQSRPAPAGSSSPAAPAAAPVTHLLVTSKKHGFRRGGRAWSETPTAIALAELSPEQLDAIEKEPMLFVRRCGAAEAAEVSANAPKPKLSPLEKLEQDNADLRGEVAQLKETVAQLVETVNRGKAPPIG